MQFVVEKDGSLLNSKVVKGLCKECDVEALRVVNAMPKWIPGQQNGRLVITYQTLPFVFK